MTGAIKLEHFRNLVSLSAVDGKITEAERASLTQIASSLGIPSERLAVMLAHAHEYVYLVPQNNHDREIQMTEMIELALVDGAFALSEREFIKSVAQRLGFTSREAEDFINDHLARYR